MRKLSLDGLKGRRTASEAVAESLRSAIRSGQLEDGAELNQVALAEHFGVSRVPVREAMRQLQAEGWITAPAHHRAVVRAVSLESIIEIFEVRAMLEVHLVSKAIPKLTPQHIAELNGRCDEMERIKDHR